MNELTLIKQDGKTKLLLDNLQLAGVEDYQLKGLPMGKAELTIKMIVNLNMPSD